MKTVRLNEYNFNYLEKGSGPTVIFVHGSASDQRIWNGQVDAFAKQFHVISYSRRFHWPNERIKEDQDYSMQQHVDDLKALIRHFGEDPVNLVGHSYGALMGIEIACSNPELLKKLVLAEPPAIRLFVSNIPRPAEILKLLLSRPRTAFSVLKLGVTGLGPATMAAKKGDMEKALKLFGNAALGKNTFESMPDEQKQQALVNLTASEFTGSGFLPIPIDTLKKNKIPTLLLTADSSRKVFSHLADRLEEIMPMIQRKKIPHSSHIMQQENVTGFNSVVLAFLKENGESI